MNSTAPTEAVESIWVDDSERAKRVPRVRLEELKREIKSSKVSPEKQFQIQKEEETIEEQRLKRLIRLRPEMVDFPTLLDQVDQYIRRYQEQINQYQQLSKNPKK